MGASETVGAGGGAQRHGRAPHETSPAAARGRGDGGAGVEFCIFDMEHSGLSLETIRSLIRWCRSTAVVPLVRVPSHEYRYVAGALDAGAQGLMIPMVESAEQAREIVSWAKYPPVG